MSRRAALLVLLMLALLAVMVIRSRKPTEVPHGSDDGVEQAGLEPRPIHAVRNEDFHGGNHYLVANLVAGPIEVECRLEDAENVRSEPPLPRVLVVPALAEVEIAQLHDIDHTKNAKASIACDAVVGDPRATVRENLTYALPFYRGTKFTLDQGFNGAYSHHDVQSRFALDLDVPAGTPVLAARDGVIMQVEEEFHGNGADGRYADRANYVRVLHEDGGMALYAHLSPGSTLYRPGEHVHTGDFLGKSGNTGLSTGPHLHFSVQRNVGMQLRSIPFTMSGVDPYRPVER